MGTSTCIWSRRSFDSSQSLDSIVTTGLWCEPDSSTLQSTMLCSRWSSLRQVYQRVQTGTSYYFMPLRCTMKATIVHHRIIAHKFVMEYTFQLLQSTDLLLLLLRAHCLEHRSSSSLLHAIAVHGIVHCVSRDLCVRFSIHSLAPSSWCYTSTPVARDFTRLMAMCILSTCLG